MAQEGAHSTKRSRAWCYTLNNYTQDEMDKLKKVGSKEGCVFHVFGKEVGEKEKTPHLQGYVYFKETKSLKQLKKILGNRASLRVTRGSSLANFRYCTKEDKDDYFLFGKMPADPQEKGRIEKERWTKIKRLALEGKLSEITPKVFVQNYRSLKQIRNDFFECRDTLDHCTGFWLAGSYGTGKSYNARTKFPGAYIKTPDQWWDDYTGQETVIIEDMDPFHKSIGRHLKIWMDKYPFPAAYKGGMFRAIRPKRIIVTSQYLPEEIWEDAKTVEAILDRSIVRQKIGKSLRTKKRRPDPFADFGTRVLKKKPRKTIALGHDCKDHGPSSITHQTPTSPHPPAIPEESAVLCPASSDAEGEGASPAPVLARSLTGWPHPEDALH